MNTSTATHAFSLTKAATKRIPDPAGLEITCTSGSIWITLENILHDVILISGTPDDAFITRSHRSALIYALSDSQFVINPPAVIVSDTQRTRAHWQSDQPPPLQTLHA